MYNINPEDNESETVVAAFPRPWIDSEEKYYAVYGVKVSEDKDDNFESVATTDEKATLYLPSETPDLTAQVASGYLYGGVYTDEDLDFENHAIRDRSGKSFSGANAGDIYYLKEVPDSYLKVKTLKRSNSFKGLLRKITLRHAPPAEK